MYTRVLVAVKLDHAGASAELVHKAQAVSTTSDAELLFVTIVPKISDNLNEVPEDSLPKLESFVAGLGFDPATSRCLVRAGAPHRAIPEAARELGCDLIALNSRNPRIHEYLMGSVASHIVMHAQCDLLVVRQVD
ncbi:universal stress protein [Phycicoccus sp. CSK15P-2]|uniref:universal stress protein n=1 Tax=Phycicoccus sp. CSK15P-2 TaxID=2807627 RepID=UPI00194DE322|nr:universal stress protein [Phycicoccus sp. CSK15P-2]MBM6405319.1 universal stress protein [Phycicoccus sp. CSK15P-2]